MGTLGFWDLEERYAKLDGLGEPLAKVSQVVEWEGFRGVLNEALRKARKNNSGRKEYDRGADVQGIGIAAVVQSE